jgi:glycosyltransferase involved in cell wall biosynthesis
VVNDARPIPVVSVVMPLYNKERDVARAVASVLTQSFADFELIVVDDGSRDGSAAVVGAIDDDRIRLLHQENGGVSLARNTGIGAARADLVAFIDADDAYRPDFLANVLALRARYPQAGAYAMNYEMVPKEGPAVPCVTSVEEPTVLLDPAAYFRIARSGSPVHSSSVAVLRTILDRAGRFPVGVRLGEDLDTWLRIIFIAPIAFDRRIGSSYLLGAGERALETNAPVERYAFFDTIDRWVATQPALPQIVRDDICEFKNFFTIMYARYQVRWGTPSEGRRVLMPLRTRAFALKRWKWLAASYLPRRLHPWIGMAKGVTR